jgi:hypothetical protein
VVISTCLHPCVATTALMQWPSARTHTQSTAILNRDSLLRLTLSYLFRAGCRFCIRYKHKRGKLLTFQSQPIGDGSGAAAEAKSAGGGTARLRTDEKTEDAALVDMLENDIDGAEGPAMSQPLSISCVPIAPRATPPSPHARRQPAAPSPHARVPSLTSLSFFLPLSCRGQFMYMHTNMFARHACPTRPHVQTHHANMLTRDALCLCRALCGHHRHGQMRPYQLEGLAFFSELHSSGLSGGILADEMVSVFAPPCS